MIAATTSPDCGQALNIGVNTGTLGLSGNAWRVETCAKRSGSGSPHCWHGVYGQYNFPSNRQCCWCGKYESEHGPYYNSYGALAQWPVYTVNNTARSTDYYTPHQFGEVTL